MEIKQSKLLIGFILGTFCCCIVAFILPSNAATPQRSRSRTIIPQPVKKKVYGGKHNRKLTQKEVYRLADKVIKNHGKKGSKIDRYFLASITKQESGWQTDPVGWNDGGRAVGMGQQHSATWEYCWRVINPHPVKVLPSRYDAEATMYAVLWYCQYGESLLKSQGKVVTLERVAMFYNAGCTDGRNRGYGQSVMRIYRGLKKNKP